MTHVTNKFFFFVTVQFAYCQERHKKRKTVQCHVTVHDTANIKEINWEINCLFTNDGSYYLLWQVLEFIMRWKGIFSDIQVERLWWPSVPKLGSMSEELFQKFWLWNRFCLDFQHQTRLPHPAVNGNLSLLLYKTAIIIWLVIILTWCYYLKVNSLFKVQ